MRIEAAGATDRGPVREHNEDAYLADASAGLFLVADGMGGLEAGEVASRLAVETVTRVLAGGPSADTLEYAPPGAPAWKPAMLRLEQAVTAANRAVFEASQTRFGPAGPGMGSTLVGLSRADDRLVLANVGDSRAYLFRDDALSLLSEDHSLVMARLRQGLISPEQAASSPDRHVIYRALGMAPTVEADLSPVAIRTGDVFVLCSDGLTDVMSDADLAGLLRADVLASPEELCRRLVAAALDRDTRDNVTVVALRIDAGCHSAL